MKHVNSRHPRIGDIIGCSDGDVGVVIATYWDYGGGMDDSLMIEVTWSSGKTYTDAWRSQDFNTSQDMFHIMSRA